MDDAFDNIDDCQAKDMLQQIVKSAGFDSYSILQNAFGYYVFMLHKDKKACPAIISKDTLGMEYYVLSMVCKSYEKHIATLDMMLKWANLGFNILAIDIAHMHKRCALWKANETYEMRMIRLDLERDIA